MASSFVRFVSKGLSLTVRDLIRRRIGPTDSTSNPGSGSSCRSIVIGSPWEWVQADATFASYTDGYPTMDSDQRMLRLNSTLPPLLITCNRQRISVGGASVVHWSIVGCFGRLCQAALVNRIENNSLCRKILQLLREFGSIYFRRATSYLFPKSSCHMDKQLPKRTKCMCAFSIFEVVRLHEFLSRQERTCFWPWTNTQISMRWLCHGFRQKLFSPMGASSKWIARGTSNATKT